MQHSNPFQKLLIGCCLEQQALVAPAAGNGISQVSVLSPVFLQLWKFTRSFWMLVWQRLQASTILHVSQSRRTEESEEQELNFCRVCFEENFSESQFM